MYGTDLETEYQAGRTLQSCDPSQGDWLSNLQLDLRAASARRKTVHCIVANTETWYVSVSIECISLSFSVFFHQLEQGSSSIDVRRRGDEDKAILGTCDYVWPSCSTSRINAAALVNDARCRTGMKYAN